jgi:hypothetical protein
MQSWGGAISRLATATATLSFFATLGPRPCSPPNLHDSLILFQVKRVPTKHNTHVTQLQSCNPNVTRFQSNIKTTSKSMSKKKIISYTKTPKRE